MDKKRFGTSLCSMSNFFSLNKVKSPDYQPYGSPFKIFNIFYSSLPRLKSFFSPTKKKIFSAGKILI